MPEEVINFDERLKQRIGRPSRVESIAIRFTEAELVTLERAAADKTTTLREWAREVLLREARRGTQDAIFTEVVATRMLLNYVLESLACGHVLGADDFEKVLTIVRTTKHKTAGELMEQYQLRKEGE